MEREQARSQEQELDAPAEAMVEPEETRSSVAFSDEGAIPAVTAEPPVAAAPATASEQGFAAKQSPGVQALNYLFDHDENVQADAVAKVMQKFPDDHHAMFALLHGKSGGAFVDEVVDVMQGPKQAVAATPEETPKAAEAPAGAEATDATAIVAAAIAQAPEPTPEAASPMAEAAAKQEPEQIAAAADPDKEESMSPDVIAMYVGAARAFLTRHLKLTHEQGELLQFDDEVAPDGGLCLEVTNIPEVVISKPEGQRNGTDSGYNDNFYASLPKDIQTPGMSHVAHVSLNGEPVDGNEQMVKIVGPTMQIQFERATPA